MKRIASLVVLVVLAASILAAAAGLISKAQAEKDALKAVNGGNVILAVLDTQGTKRIWSVDIVQPANEYEVHVDAHTGAILKIIVQPGGMVNGRSLLTKPAAEHEAENAAGSGTVLDAKLEKDGTEKIWSVDLSKPESETEVQLDAYTGQILKIITQPSNTAKTCTYLTKAKAEADALAAVGGGTVLLAVLETRDHPAVWSVDTANSRGEFEVKVNACTGKIVAIVPGG
jgi:uncharacterized membrane protein YkoI